jgi:hypothetical protein
MRAEEVMVRALLAVMLLFLIGVTASAMRELDLHLIIIWSTIVLLIGIGAGTLFGMVPKSLRGPIAIVVALLIIIAIMLQGKLIPVCGDDVCSTGECSRCTKDCGPADCRDGKCDLKIERCDTSSDCACAPDLACAPNRQGADNYGCASIICGDGFCDGFEGPSTCCKDCGCQTGFKCESNICFFEMPKVRFIPYRLTTSISALSLYGNPMLTTDAGQPRPLMALEISTSKSITNLSATFSIEGLVSDRFDLGTLYSEQQSIVGWYVKPDSRLLRLAEDKQTAIDVLISYNDAQGDRHELERDFPLIVLSRNTLDGFGHPVLFVTNDTRTKATTAEGIWNELSSSITVVQRPGNRIQFPAETLVKGEGSRNDIAVLLVSAYERAGVRSSLVDSPDGLFVRVRMRDYYAIVDPALFDRPFNDAIAVRPGYAIYEPEKVRQQRNLTIISSSALDIS